MAGVLFVVCIPTGKYETKLRKTDGVNKTDVPSKVFNFNNVKSNSSDNLLSARVQEKNGTKSREEVGTAEELSAFLKSRSELVFIDVDSAPDLSGGARPLLDDVARGDVGDGDGKDKDVNLNRTPTLLDLPHQDEDPLMEKILEELLKQMKIDNAVWCAGRSDNFYQVFFSAGSEVCEEALAVLQEWGIGIILNSIVSVIPCSLYYDGMEHAASEDDLAVERPKKDAPYVSAWDKFVASVGARLTVAQVVERVKCDACLTFDFLVLLLIAGVVATLGLIENSTVILVASMLISPLMGPIMAGTFGFVIEDKRLRKMGILNELVGLSLCLLVGFGIGLAVGMTEDYGGSGSFPTEEMLSRGKVRSLWVGALIALPSGAAVAIALLGDKTGSLVGVAISASILPPAVNAGLLWALALINAIWAEATGTDLFVPPSSNATATVPPEPAYVYSEDKSVELAILGVVSLCLTLVNILCIFLMGILVLKIKEVAPRTSGKQSQFWRHDIKIARDYNKTLNKEDGLMFQKQLADELAGLTEADLSSHHISPERIMNISHRLVPHRNQQTWSPSVRTNSENRLTLQELEDLYMDLTGTKRTQSPVRRSSSLKPSTDPAAVPPWYRHISPPAGLPTILETTASPLQPGMPKRRMTYASHDVPAWQYQPPNRKRFVVSPVEEEEPTQ